MVLVDQKRIWIYLIAVVLQDQHYMEIHMTRSKTTRNDLSNVDLVTLVHQDISILALVP